MDYSAFTQLQDIYIPLFLLCLFFFAFNLDLAASRIFIGLTQGQHGSCTELSTDSVSKIGQPAPFLRLPNPPVLLYARTQQKKLHNGDKALAISPVWLKIQRLIHILRKAQAKVLTACLGGISIAPRCRHSSSVAQPVRAADC